MKDCDALGVPQEDVVKRDYKDPEIKEKLALLAKKYPSYKRNQAHICSFFVKGECNRGENCPFRHEMPDEEEVKVDENGKKIKNQSVEQSIRDRFNGVNDSLATKMITKIKKHEKPDAPENKKITTLFIGGVDEDLEETDIVEFFKKYGKVMGIRVRHKSKCAFICFDERSSAELAIDHLFNKLFIKEKRLKLLWAKDQLDLSKNNKRSRVEGNNQTGGDKSGSSAANQSTGRLIISDEKGYYPSMDPSNYVSSFFNVYVGRRREEERNETSSERLTVIDMKLRPNSTGDLK